jgi:hypothetical protein
MKKTRNNKAKAGTSVEKLLPLYSTRLRFGGGDVVSYQLRQQTPPAELFLVFPKLFSAPGTLAALTGPAFPATADEMHQVSPASGPGTTPNELVWAIARCLQHSKLLSRFCELRRQFEDAVLSDSRERAHEALDQIRRELGFSSWLLQAHLAVAQHWGGLEALQSTAKVYEGQLEAGSVAHFLFWFAKRRVEATSLKDRLRKDLNEITENIDSDDFTAYLVAKIFDVADVPLDGIAGLPLL